MSTKLYFNLKTSDWKNTGGDWDTPPDYDLYGTYANTHQMLHTEKWGSPAASAFSPDCDSYASPVKICHYRGISQRLSPQTINGTFDAIFAVSQGLSTDDCFTKINIYIMDENPGGTPFDVGYLLQLDESSGGTEWSVNWSTRGLASAATLSPIVIPSDGRFYRMVIELGLVTNRLGTANIITRMQHGTRGSDWVKASDMVTGYGPSTTAPTGAPHCTFSHDFLFAGLQYAVSNHEPEDAVDVGNQPVALNIVAPSTAGTNPPAIDRWWKYTESADKFMGVLSCSSGSPGSDTNTLTVYAELDEAIDGPPFVTIISSVKRMVAVPIATSRVLYFKLLLGSLVDTMLRVENAPTTAVAAGDLLVLSDNHGENFYDDTKPGGNMPSVFISPLGVIKYVTGLLLGGEIAVSLANGLWAAADQYISHNLIIYDKAPNQLNEIIRVSFGGLEISSMGTDFQSFFPICNDGLGESTVFKVSSAGVIDPTTWTIPVEDAGAGLYSSALSRNANILYYRNNATMDQISRYDLLNDLPLTAFSITGVAEINDIIVLNDSTIIVACYNIDTSVNDHRVVHLDAAGSVLHTYSVPKSASGGGTLHHLIHAADDSTSQIWIWLQPESVDTGGNAKNRFQLLNIETGTIVSEFDDARSGTTVPYDATCDPTVKFSSPGSCPLMIMMTPVGPPPPGDPTGIHIIVPTPTPGTPGQRHDVYNNDVSRKIPNPTIRTALFGE